MPLYLVSIPVSGYNTCFLYFDSSKKSFPHDIKTKSGLTKLYNQKVVSVQPVERPLAGLNNGKIANCCGNCKLKLGVKTSISGQKSRATHSGVVVRTEDGGRYLAHGGWIWEIKPDSCG